MCAYERLHAPPPPLRKSCIHACNMPSRSVEIKQPPQRRPKLAIHCRVPLSLYCRVSPPPQPGLAVSTSRSCRIHCRVPLPLLPGPAVSTAGSRRLYCWVPAVSLQSTNGAFTPEQDNDKTTTRQKLNLCISIMPFTPGPTNLV